MKLTVVIIAFLISNSSFAQTLETQKSSIDSEVHHISKQSDLTKMSFSIQVLKKIIHYQYLARHNEYLKITRQFSVKGDTIQQTFYLQKGGLIYSTEKITSYFTEAGKTDSMIWKGDYYFANGKLIDYVTLGHGKSEIDTWNPEQEILAAFIESKKDIDKHKKKKNGG
jgi:hypothetical protein